eukprot:1661393-Pleurochrysis_carterae.AAC.1
MLGRLRRRNRPEHHARIGRARQQMRALSRARTRGRRVESGGNKRRGAARCRRVWSRRGVTI